MKMQKTLSQEQLQNIKQNEIKEEDESQKDNNSQL
jgi:hypothetical protein